jgi:hypothetical protein
MAFFLAAENYILFGVYIIKTHLTAYNTNDIFYFFYDFDRKI